MKKNTLPKPVSTLILAMMAAAIWVGSNIYRSITIKPSPAVPENISKKITPSLNLEAIEKVQKATFIPDSELPPLLITPTVKGTPIPTETPVPVLNLPDTSSPSGTESSGI